MIKEKIYLLILTMIYVYGFGNEYKINNINFQKSFGGNDQERAYDLEVVEDGYIVVGTTCSKGQIKGAKNAWIIKIDKKGNKVWDYPFKGKEEGGFYSINILENGEILIGGDVKISDENHDLWLLKLDRNGKFIGQSFFGTKEYESFNAIQVLDDNGYILTGSHCDKKFRCNDFIFKVDKNGNEVWKQIKEKYTVLNGIVEDKNHELHIAGCYHGGKGTHSNGTVWDHIFDKNGKTIKQVEVYINRKEYAYCPTYIVKEDENYILAGFGSKKRTKGVSHAWIGKIDKNSKIIWNNIYGNELVGEVKDIQKTKDNGYLVISQLGEKSKNGFVGFDDIEGGGIYVFKIDKRGKKIWEKYIHNRMNPSAIKEIDNGFIVVGNIEIEGKNLDIIVETFNE